MAELTYKDLLEEILIGDLKELRIHPLDMLALENRIYDMGQLPMMVRFHDDIGIFIDFNGCKIRSDRNTPSRGWK